MISRVYIAAPYQMRADASALRMHLERHGISCTSHWIDGPMPHDQLAAARDINDVKSSEALILMNPESFKESGTGGRHTELGMALILQLPIFVLGTRTQIFHTLPQILVFDLAIDLIEALKLVVPPARLPLSFAEMLRALIAHSHSANKKWWVDMTGRPVNRNVGELLMLTVSELAEAMEGHRKSLPDDKLPHRPMFEVEMADALIRIFDFAGGFDLDVAGAYEEKTSYNAVRVDHTHEHRQSAHGKKY